MDVWKQALIDFGILWAGASLITLFATLATCEGLSVLAMCARSITNGAIGAGAGIGVIEKLGIRLAIAVAAFVGTGLLGKELIVAIILKKLGLNDSRRDNPDKPA